MCSEVNLSFLMCSEVNFRLKLSLLLFVNKVQITDVLNI